MFHIADWRGSGRKVRARRAALPLNVEQETPQMGTLASRSAIVLALLFGLVFAVGSGVAYYYDVPISFAVAFAVIVVFLQFLIGPWIIEHLFSIQWARPEELGADFAHWYVETCAARKIRVPRLGVIHDGNPNAFTFGHTPSDARVVVTTGLLEMLDKDETHAVVAHELGHVAHYDFIVMTIAQLAPLILYVIYRFSRHRVRGNHEGAIAAGVAAGAYVAYLVSQYVVLFLSRVREYFADEASGMTTHEPDKLSTALVKIAYGLALRPPVSEGKVGADGKKKSGFGMDPGRATAALGICSAVAAPGFAMTAAGPDGTFSPTVMAEAMQWDLKNPWGTWFELNSTHPLVARRVMAMSRMSRRFGLPVDMALDPKGVHRVYKGNFAIEFITYALPLIAGLAGLGWGYAHPGPAGSVEPIGLALCGAGIGWLIKTIRCYPATSAKVREIRDLVSTEISVSPVTPVPCALEGTIIGRGVPGLFFSQNPVVHDGTGFLTLQYRQPFGILEFLFGWMKAGSYVNRKARIYGWFRRAPVPYFEIQRVEMLDGPTGNIRCYALYGFYVMAVLMVLGGLAMMGISSIL